MEEIEKLTKAIENETDFEKVVALFSQAAILVKQKLAAANKSRGKIVEIIRDLDTFIEKELKLGGAVDA